MTTNERMNLARYVHFHTSRRGFYDSPFNRGYWQNLVDFAEFRCLGFLRPIKDDWYNTYDTEDFVGKVKNTGLYHKEVKSCCRQPEDREPLLTVWSSTGNNSFSNTFRKGFKLRFLRNAWTASSLMTMTRVWFNCTWLLLQVIKFFQIILSRKSSCVNRKSNIIIGKIKASQYFSHLLWRNITTTSDNFFNFHCIFL